MPSKINLYARATQESLKNAQRWIEDAKLLMEDSSFGHAEALLRLACEEIAKAHVCWLTTERILPTDNEMIKTVFRYHRVKNKLILGTLFVASGMRLSELEDEDSAKEEAMLDSTEKMRHKAMYVDVVKSTGEITSPLQIEEEPVNGILRFAELYLKNVRSITEKASENDKEKMRDAARGEGLWD